MALDQLREAKSFLTAPRADLQTAALDIFKQLSTNDEMLELFRQIELVDALVPMLSEEASLAYRALVVLVNASVDTELHKRMIELRVIEVLIERLREEQLKNRALFVLLLSNLTTTEQGQRQLLQLDEHEGKLKGLHFLRLLSWFISPSMSQHDEYARLAHVFTNVTQLKEGRDLVTSTKRQVLRFLAPYIMHPGNMRRAGVIGVIRNCAMDTTCHSFLLSEEGTGVFPMLLLPLAGYGDYTEEELKKMHPALASACHDEAEQERESNTEIRRLIAETLRLLLEYAPSRRTLKKWGVYPLLREYHKWESDDHLDDFLQELMPFLLMPEDDESPLQMPDMSGGGYTTTTELWHGDAPTKVEEVGSDSDSELDSDDEELLRELEEIQRARLGGKPVEKKTVSGKGKTRGQMRQELRQKQQQQDNEDDDDLPAIQSLI
ncbi:MAG: hypothetical protein MHM6MM_000018 [Cercozoa sp. M6MM]